MASQTDTAKPVAETPAAATPTDADTTGDSWMTSMVNSVTGCCGVFDKAAADKTEEEGKTEADKAADASATDGAAPAAADTKTEKA